MNNANLIDIAMVTVLGTAIVTGLVAAGMTSAIVAGAAISGIYTLVK